MPEWKRNEPGVCPQCGEEGRLDYGCAEIDDGTVEYPYECNACHFKGHEYYTLQFDSHVDEYGHEPNQEGFNSEIF
jgi:hypothetical protein